jgi:hypothetical protein
MADKRLDGLKLMILPGKPEFGFPYGDAHDAAYRFWLSYWVDVRQDVGLPVCVSADDFLRHDFVNVLVHDGSVVAMVNSTLLDFHRLSAAGHSYVSTYFGEEFRAAIQAWGLHRMATMENIVAELHWRRAAARNGVSLGAVITALALNKARDAGCDGAFGAARADVATARISYDLGARPVVRGRCFHGKTTDLVAWAFPAIHAHPVEAVRCLVERLWSERLDTTSLNGSDRS